MENQQENNNKPNETKKIMSAIIIVAVVAVVFIVFLTVDFTSEPGVEERRSMPVEDIGRVVDEFSETLNKDQQDTVDAVNNFNPNQRNIDEVKKSVDNFSQS